MNISVCRVNASFGIRHRETDVAGVDNEKDPDVSKSAAASGVLSGVHILYDRSVSAHRE